MDSLCEFEEIEDRYPLIVIPIIGPSDSDEGAYARFHKKVNAVVGSTALRHELCRSRK